MKQEEMLPRLDYFTNRGIWTGSSAFPNKMSAADEMRYRAWMADDGLSVCVWRGPNCYQKAEIAAESTFALSEEGLHAAYLWLEEQKTAMIKGAADLS